MLLADSILLRVIQLVEEIPSLQSQKKYFFVIQVHSPIALALSLTREERVGVRVKE